MDKIVALIVAFLFVVSCSTTGRIVTNQGISSEANSLQDQISPGISRTPSKIDRARTPLGLAKPQTGIKPPNSDDDDDITALLGHNDFRDFDIPIVFNDAVKYYIIYFTTDKKKVFANWLRRSRRYVPMITEILKEHGLPEDLVYLAMIESGFNAKAYSPAAACGPWQFIYATGERYGLKVNFWVDERRDPEKSTIAAAKYLTDLFNQFGCWYLAAAGYNAGEKRVERAIEKHNTSDFWELAKYNALPRETREYIPKLIAASIIAKDPEKFGFGNITYEEPLRFTEVRVPRATPLTAIARANSMDLAKLKFLNPEILRGITPPDTDNYSINLPSPVNAPEFNRALETAMHSERRIKGVIVYKVKKKDTLAKIFKKYGVREEEMRLVNNCDQQIRIKQGMALNIPRFSGPVKPGPSTAAVISNDAGDERRTKGGVKIAGLGGIGDGAARTAKSDDAPNKITGKPHQVEKEKEPNRQENPPKSYHVVRKGETLSEISTKYGVDVASLKSINNLKNGKVYPDMKLKLVSYSQKKRMTATRFHVVRNGETLVQISNKYGVSVAALKSANSLKNEKVRPKMRLKIPLSQG
jgi:membrane-bound lytic murein transglycosylase D